MRLVLVGPPGSGKGTQADLLAKRLGLSYVGTGEILRDAVRRQTETGRVAGPPMAAGRLVPDPVVNESVAEVFRGAGRPERFVADGYPRTLAQAVAFDALLRQQFLQLDAVVHLAVDDGESVRRTGGRRCCPNPVCGACYNSGTKSPKRAGSCDKCGSPLVTRDDDREEIVRRRLAEFHANNAAVLDHYGRQGLVRTVPAAEPVEAVYVGIVRVLT